MRVLASAPVGNGTRIGGGGLVVRQPASGVAAGCGAVVGVHAPIGAQLSVVLAPTARIQHHHGRQAPGGTGADALQHWFEVPTSGGWLLTPIATIT